jgi:hypothetical protein
MKRTTQLLCSSAQTVNAPLCEARRCSAQTEMAQAKQEAHTETADEAADEAADETSDKTVGA